MGHILFHYTPVAPTTWAYLSSLLMVGLYFKFNRFFCVRNLDLVLLILLAPGLLLQHFGREMELLASPDPAEASQVSGLPFSVPDFQAFARVIRDQSESDNPGIATSPGIATLAGPNGVDPNQAGPNQAGPNQAGPNQAGPNQVGPSPAGSNSGAAGAQAAVLSTPAPAEGQRVRGKAIQFIGFVWLFSVSGLLLLRALLDPGMVRRPLLEPNLSTGGLTFLACSLFVFLMANVITSSSTKEDLEGPRSAEQLLHAEITPSTDATNEQRGPGNALLHLLPSIPTMPLSANNSREIKEIAYIAQAKTMAILSHLAVVVGMVAIGYRHFANIKMGIGAAALYLMLPYTAQMTGRVPHVLPAAFLVWAILCYRRPLTAGLFIGMAIGVVYYPIYLLPLWISFYWQRGLGRFLAGVGCMMTLCALLLIVVSNDLTEFVSHLRGMFGIWAPKMEGLGGIWGLGWSPQYRIPIMTAFILLSLSFALWPARKNLGTLLSCTSAVMIATQFWNGNGGGLMMAWYLPTLIMTIFRPNLEDRIALSVLGESWLSRRRKSLLRSTAFTDSQPA